ncbi:MAG: hypothetical protein ACR2HG_06625 [Pyrinomonadaceae bacterium]
MFKTKIAFSIAAFFAVCLFGLINCLAQNQTAKTQIEPSYEVILQTVVGSNNSNAKTEIPQTLSSLLKNLKAYYSYSNYHLTSTFLQRVASRGTIEFKGVFREAVQNQDANFSVFSEWTLNDLQSLPNAKGQNSIQFQNFRFGQRVPVTTSSNLDVATGKTNSVVNYEQIGLTLQKFSLPENAPTVIGSLSTSKPDEMMFLILTVKPADE